jgi:hypothetical protein
MLNLHSRNIILSMNFSFHEYTYYVACASDILLEWRITFINTHSAIKLPYGCVYIARVHVINEFDDFLNTQGYLT